MLAAYDLLFRSVGALLPFCILIPRAVGLYVLEGCAFPATTLHKNLMYIYMGMTVLRAVVYNVVLVGALCTPTLPFNAHCTPDTATGGSQDEGQHVVKAFRHQFMSDHVFLAACVVAILMSEAAILLRVVRYAA